MMAPPDSSPIDGLMDLTLGLLCVKSAALTIAV
jgi:hypothetical protein